MLSSSLRNPAVRRWATTTTTSSSRWASTLVISDPLNEAGETPPGTQSAVTAAGKFGQAVALLVVGESPPNKIPEGVTSVYYVGIGDKLSETVASSIQAVAMSKDCNIVVGTASKFGSTVIPRAAALLESSPITDILEIQDANTFVRPMYAGNVLCKVTSKNNKTPIKVLSIRPTSFEKAALVDASNVDIETIDGVTPFAAAEWISEAVSKSDRPDLGR